MITLALILNLRHVQTPPMDSQQTLFAFYFDGQLKPEAGLGYLEAMQCLINIYKDTLYTRLCTKEIFASHPLI